MKCELCEFKNPKGSVTAVIIKDGKLLLLQRNEEPFRDMWDLPGGYMQADERPIDALKREIKEELGIKCEPTYIREFMGWAMWKDKKFPVINFAFLVNIGNQEIILNDENCDCKWEEIGDIDTKEISFDSNREIVNWVKKNFDFIFSEVKELAKQLDNTVTISEFSLYKAVLNGYVSKKYWIRHKLAGLGWIFPRQTMLRKQAVIEDMIVNEGYRGKGIGKEILKDLINWAKNNEVEVIELTTNPSRIVANSLYKKLGFKLHETNHYLLKL